MMNDNNITTPDEVHQDRNMNDVPGSSGMDASELVSSLLSNEHIPKKLREEMWILFSQTIKLSFITDADVNWFSLQWELLRLTVIESIPKSLYNEELERDLIMAGMEFRGNILRAKGGKMNERELLGSSTSASFSERNMGSQASNPGFLDKLSSMFGGGK